MSINVEDDSKLLDSLKNLHEQVNKHHAYNNEHNPSDYEAICRTWAKRDYWTVLEGLNLLCRCRPQKSDWKDGVLELWSLAKSCIGPNGTLKVINPEISALTDHGLAKTHNIHPKDLLIWAKQKGISIPNELEIAVLDTKLSTAQTIIRPDTRTTHANQKRQNNKSKRIQALIDFFNEIEKRAIAAGLPWDKLDIPITKQDLKNLFYRINPDLPKVSKHQFEDDMELLGAKFRNGVRTNIDNYLEKLF